MGQEYSKSTKTIPQNNVVPVLPLRDVVVYPHIVIPLFVGRDKSIQAIDSAMQSNKQILLTAQKSADVDDPDVSDMYAIGTLANILQLLKLPDGSVKVLVEGGERACITEFIDTDEFFTARLETLIDSLDVAGRETEVLMRSATNLFDQYVKLNKKVPPEVLTSLSSIDDPSRLTDTIAAHMTLKLEEKQQVLEMPNVRERLEHLMGLMEGENDILQTEKRIRGRVKRQMEKNQREYYLNEEMKAIQKELGEMDDAPNEIEDLTKKIETVGMTKEAKDKAVNELNKLKLMSSISAEATVVRNYIDTLVGLPWKKRSKIRNDIGAAEAVLDEDHYGLEKVKERILEYLAVQQRVRKLKGPILCLVGPPGVGKTSLGQSIARATNRKFTRMALGGVCDEAEIRGHRRTYIGALPGKIINNLSKVKTRNPLFLLDEIDKMAMDFRGDPASALLEVLDPEQNHTFNDHYLEVDFDLSEVMFVATANTLNIPAALLDRMEVIRLSGYTEDEKVNIAERYLVRKQIVNNGLKPNELSIREAAIRDMVRYYTREAGVRNLEREIAKVCRKVVKEILLKKPKGKITITPKHLDDYLGVQRFRYGRADEHDQVGQVTGLAWTEVGGELLHIEAALMPGKGRLSHTGQLGEVMQESIQAAMTVVRSRANSLALEEDFHQKHDVHIHVPEGATPKDGPSAGVGMCISLVSALTKIPVRADVAMTGEITLRGEILPIGGLKEKLLAAHRGGIATVIIPEENERDLVDIPKNIKQNLDIRPVRWIDEVLQIALKEVLDPKDAKLTTATPKKRSEKSDTEETKKRGAPTKH
ncbi:MAG: endopeptidase La [Candidatus Thiodiazotropha sp. (ex Lucinoma aequizonata)]|nr:endopeptidase La [Candidatus Thiodiazotropha sp. (ex Lucinoma aequizonata)]MCU7889100.1 endopeptidase La [Candidatus Thiodiazotropha sp. (ex Lucinoma aequizonata)]MCU7894202.1 endopeptidase La [Candidatus Thiodiazotropha sp. (ex Lucinoma aequizonata)]MCU7899406.1 endopeptidase La [Candidatus Thiodiazotropha sp. (ex Lucinoma aequizonata)]MCU7902507.1 endopeptidase La [Candidatus Thiodiazotropha sp. (ex Lucinoma aequizonata)]